MILSLKYAAIICCMTIAAFLGCGDKPALSLSEKDNGASVETEKGKLIEVRLAGSMGTGYSWQLLNEPHKDLAFTMEKEPEIFPLSSNREDITGGPDETVFLLKAMETGKAKLRFVYIRIWEQDKPPAKEFSVDVDVK